MKSGAKYAAYTVAAAAIVATAMRFDGWAYQHFVLPDVYERDWGRLLRMAGYLPTWIVVAAGTIVADRSIRTWRQAARAPGALVLCAATLGGIVGELLKIIVRRERPDAGHGAYLFRAWSDHTFSSAGFGMPSGHAIVAFSAAAMLSRLSPRGRALWIALAIGCAATRVASRAHFLSDVVVAALIAPLVAAFVAQLRPIDRSAGAEGFSPRQPRAAVHAD